jgi:hypothetical protein
MNEMSKQMDMFQDGGLMDEGGTVDPVSGNDVPPGSNQEEVRDDIPAQLSEGEFVFPADVVRYFGLEKLMEMRQEAKMGLQRMDDMGQMGNSEEAIMPDNLPFDIDDIDMEDDSEPQEFNLGGVVQQPGTGIAGYTPPPSPTTGYTPPPVGVAVAPVVPGSQPQVAFTPATSTTNVPTFGEFVGTGGGKYDELVTYVNDAGQTMQIPHINGKPIYPVPEGFKRQEKPTDTAPESPLVEKTAQQPQGDGGGGDDAGGISTGTGTAKVGSISEAMASLFGGDKDAPKGRSVGDIFESATNKNNYFGGSKAFGWSNDELRGATFKQAGAQVGSMGLTGIVSAAAQGLGLTNFNLKDVGVAGFTGMNNALNSLGLTNRGQLMNSEQASLVGKTMAAAHAAAFNNKDVKGAINSMLNSKQAKEIQNNAYNAIKNAYAEKAGARGTFTDKDFADEMARVERSAVADLNRGFNRQSPRDSRPGQDVDSDFRSNVVTDSKGNPVTSKSGNVLTETGRAKKEELEAIANQARVNKQQAKKAEEERQRKAYEADKARAAQAKAQRERAAAIAAQYNENSRDRNDGGGDSGERSGDDTSAGSVGVDSTGTSTGYGSEEDCLTEDMKVKLNGVIDFVTNIKVGDMIDNYKVKEVLHKHMRSGYYAINNELKISNDHPVLANGTWTRPEDLVVGDNINGIPVLSLEYVERMTPTVSIVIDGESFDVHTENNIYTVHGRYREVRQEAA